MSPTQNSSSFVLFSGQVTEDLKLGETHKSYLTSTKVNSFMEVIPELRNWNNSYLFEDCNRTILSRVNVPEQPFGDRFKNHKDAFLLMITPTQQISRLYNSYPDESITEDVIRRRGKLQDIKQQVELGMERCNQDEILSLFDRSQEEEKFLKKLSWQSSYKGSLANRK